MLQTDITIHWVDTARAKEIIEKLDPDYGHMVEIEFVTPEDGWLEFKLRASYSEDIPAEDIILVYLEEFDKQSVTFSWTNIHNGNKIHYGICGQNVSEFKEDAQLLSRWRDVAIYGALGF